MSGTECNYQKFVTAAKLATAFKDARCHHCGVTSGQLLQQSELLEVCGEEFASDIVSGEQVFTPIALCPACHRQNHIDARNNHNPCQIKARFSREGLG